MLRPGGTVSGPTPMAMADCAIYAALLTAIGPVALAVTTNLTMNFLRKAPAGSDLVAEATVMKLGRRLAVAEARLRAENGEEIVAHATAAYAIPSTF